jgi:hypothetical protein
VLPALLRARRRRGGRHYRAGDGDGECDQGSIIPHGCSIESADERSLLLVELVVW